MKGDKPLKFLIYGQRGATMIICLFIILVLLAFAGLLIDGSQVILKFNQLFHCTYIAAEANLASYDREVWQERREVELDFVLSEAIIKDVLTSNMKEAHVVSVEPTSKDSLNLTTECDIPLIIMKGIGTDKWVIQSETGFFSIY